MTPLRSPLEDVAGRIALENVRLQYGLSAEERLNGVSPNGTGRLALDGVSLEIAPGQLAAFVGPSGAGKTTISYLIPRLYDVTEGAVKIDDVDVRDIRLAALARLIGYVSQESYLFHASLRENLMYGDPNASEEEMICRS